VCEFRESDEALFAEHEHLVADRALDSERDDQRDTEGDFRNDQFHAWSEETDQVHPGNYQ
jgi:hypothetical protein